MRFECGDLERALAVPELMLEAREHLKICAKCRNEYRVWSEISSTARELHEEWESPQLWPQIRTTIEAELEATRKRNRFSLLRDWRMWSLAAGIAGVAVLAVVLMKPVPVSSTGATVTASKTGATADATFLTENALAEVEKNEAAYRQSIERLARLAQPEIAKAADAVAVNYRERLLLLDSAISETRASLEQNRYSVQLQNELADLYHQKQKALEELVTRDEKTRDQKN